MQKKIFYRRLAKGAKRQENLIFCRKNAEAFFPQNEENRNKDVL